MSYFNSQANVAIYQMQCAKLKSCYLAHTSRSLVRIGAFVYVLLRSHFVWIVSRTKILRCSTSRSFTLCQAIRFKRRLFIRAILDKTIVWHFHIFVRRMCIFGYCPLFAECKQTRASFLRTILVRIILAIFPLHSQQSACLRRQATIDFSPLETFSNAFVACVTSIFLLVGSENTVYATAIVCIFVCSRCSYSVLLYG